MSKAVASIITINSAHWNILKATLAGRIMAIVGAKVEMEAIEFSGGLFRRIVQGLGLFDGERPDSSQLPKICLGLFDSFVKDEVWCIRGFKKMEA